MNILKWIFKREKGKMNESNESIYGATHVGMRREGNEDCYLILSEHNIYMVADGMGGHNAGEVASKIAVDSVAEYFTDERISEIKADQEKIGDELNQSVLTAHQRILDMSKEKTEYSGMGSTIAIAFILDNVIHTCNVGDSRVYVINPSGIIQITKDHSVVAELVESGNMTKEEARLSTMKNQITQALGAPFPVNPEYNKTELNEGDIVLLCSDGLWDMLSDEDINAIVMEGNSMESTCNKLIEKANEAGGDDNITVVLVKITKEEMPSEAEKS
jgi:serine/threonine protein phosphatase PrpC